MGGGNHGGRLEGRTGGQNDEEEKRGGLEAPVGEMEGKLASV